MTAVDQTAGDSQAPCAAALEDHTRQGKVPVQVRPAVSFSRRGFLKALGIGAAAVAAPVVGRRIWQVHRDAPVRAAKVYEADLRAYWNGVELPVVDVKVELADGFGDWPPMHYRCRSVVRPGDLVGLGDDGGLVPASRHRPAIGVVRVVAEQEIDKLFLQASTKLTNVPLRGSITTEIGFSA